jgi:hypothetical protein
MAVQQESKEQSKKEKDKAAIIEDYDKYKKQRTKYSDAMKNAGRYDRYPYNLSEKELMKLLAYADEDKVFGSKVKAGEIRDFLNDRATDKVLSRPEFRKDGGMVTKNKSKVAGKLALRGYGRAMKGKK